MQKHIFQDINACWWNLANLVEYNYISVKIENLQLIVWNEIPNWFCIDQTTFQPIDLESVIYVNKMQYFQTSFSSLIWEDWLI